MLIDSYKRTITYLRISVTERCNFRCQYCMPEKPFSWLPKEDILSFEDLFLLVKIAIDEGVTKIRITGGEPLLRSDLEHFIAMINNYKRGLDLAVTTNGFLLKDYALKLKVAGLKRVNVSLDSLKQDVAAKIAQKNILSSVKAGIEEAIKVGLIVKINMVPIKGINENEIIDILEYAKKRGVNVRFIEYMENIHAKEKFEGLGSEEIQNLIATKYHFKAIGRICSSPAYLYELIDGYKFGIIDPHKHDFCKECNRIRLTANGMLTPCLYFEEAISVKEALLKRDRVITAEILREVIKNKPEKNKWNNKEKNQISTRAFYETGG